MSRNAKAFEVPWDSPRRYEAGAYQFLHYGGQRVGIVHACPCGCGARSSLMFRGLGGGSPEWDVVGEWPAVTLSPSIGVKPLVDGRHHWHGYLEAGVFVER